MLREQFLPKTLKGNVHMEWDSKYELGEPTIDAQHQELFSLLRKLKKATQKGGDPVVFANTLKALVNYTKWHFTEEEQFQETIGYPLREEHKLYHQKLIDQLKNILIELRNGQKVKEVSLLRFLNEWISRHVLQEDMKIKKYQQNKSSIATPQKKVETELSKNKEEIRSVFKSLTQQYQQEVLDHDTYMSECRDVFATKFDLYHPGEMKGFTAAMSLLDYILDTIPISGDDKQSLSEFLVQKSITMGILDSFSSPEAQKRFLKNLLSERQISAEFYSQLEEKINKKAQPKS